MHMLVKMKKFGLIAFERKGLDADFISKLQQKTTDLIII